MTWPVSTGSGVTGVYEHEWRQTGSSRFRGVWPVHGVGHAARVGAAWVMRIGPLSLRCYGWPTHGHINAYTNAARFGGQHVRSRTSCPPRNISQGTSADPPTTPGWLGVRVPPGALAWVGKRWPVKNRRHPRIAVDEGTVQNGLLGQHQSGRQQALTHSCGSAVF